MHSEHTLLNINSQANAYSILMLLVITPPKRRQTRRGLARGRPGDKGCLHSEHTLLNINTQTGSDRCPPASSRTGISDARPNTMLTKAWLADLVLEMVTRNRHLVHWMVGLVVVASLSGSLTAQDLILAGGTLIDPKTETLTSAHLEIRDGKIVGRPAALPEDPSVDVLDISGGFVVPAFHDLHTHSHGNVGVTGMEMLGTPRAAKRMLFFGVARFLDLFNMEAVILPMRDRQRKSPSSVPGAEIFAAGPCLTATGGHCTEYGVPTRVINSPKDARREIGELAEKKPDVIKVVYDNSMSSLPTIDRPTLDAVVAAAHDHGLTVVVHIGSWEGALDAVEAGADALTHVPVGKAPDGLFQQMQEKSVVSIPTLAVQLDLSAIRSRPSLLDSELLVAGSSEALLKQYDALKSGAELSEALERFATFQLDNKASFLSSVKALSDAGVTILTGTDGGNPGVFQGYSVHREMGWLVEAGLTPWQALRASTTDAGKFLGIRSGLDPGDEGTLVILGESPIEDISNTESIQYVIQRGVPVDRSSGP